MEKLNFLSIFVASFIPFLLGSIWYSPTLFGTVWQKEINVLDRAIQPEQVTRAYFVSWVLSFITVTAFALYLGEKPAFAFAVIQGLYVGCFFVATSFGINYQFTNRSFKIFLVDSFYYIIQFTLYGVVLSIMTKY